MEKRLGFDQAKMVDGSMSFMRGGDGTLYRWGPLPILGQDTGLADWQYRRATLRDQKDFAAFRLTQLRKV